MRRQRFFRAALGGMLAFATLYFLPPAPAAAFDASPNVASGTYHGCVIDTEEDAYCWGGNWKGQLGNGTYDQSLIPVKVSGSHDWASIYAGHDTTCALTTSGAAYCWGYGSRNGDGTTNDQPTPTAVSGGYTFIALSVGFYHACGVVTGGDMYCWGGNNNGQLGDNSTSHRNSPVLVNGGHDFKAVSAGQFHTCGITTSDDAYCWGKNNDGQVGDNSTSERHVPTAVGGGLKFSQVSSGAAHTCGIITTGEAYCWGYNGQGQHGDNSWDQHLTPSPVSGGYTWTSITTSDGFTCGVRSNSTGYCWGRNDLGQLGLGDTNNRMIPTAIGSHSWLAINAGEVTVCAVTTNGSVYCWGWGGEGQHGNNATEQEESPVIAWTRVETNDTTVSFSISPAMTFTVSGRASVCNDQSPTNFQTGSSSTLVDLGKVTPATVAGGAQDLEVETNAAAGFVVYLRTPGTTPNVLRSTLGHTIADVGGTSASPGSAPVAGTPGFGYTSSDASTNFTSNTWAKITNSNESVLIGNSGTKSKTACVGYEAAIDGTTPAGIYSVTVIYTAVPAF